MIRLLNRSKNLLLFHSRSIQTHSIKSLLDKSELSDQVRVVGWVKSVRNQKEIKFLHLNDGSDARSLQLVILMENFANQTDTKSKIETIFDALNFNSSIEAVGQLVKSSHGKQKSELVVSDMKLIGTCKPDKYPFQSKVKYNLEQLRPFIHMRAHVDIFASIMRFRSRLVLSFHDYFHLQGFYHIHTPIITTNNCEGGCETFEVVTNQQQQQQPQQQQSNSGSSESRSKFFNKSAYLTASAQLHLEAMTSTLGKVYTMSPTFRAEKSMTKHHLAEFYMLEVESIDMNELDQLIDLAEHMVKEVGKQVLAKFDRQELDQLYMTSMGSVAFKRAQKLEKDQSKYFDFLQTIINNESKRFARISYEEAIEILNGSKEKSSAKRLQFGDDFSKEQEKSLVDHFNGTPVFIKHYPRSLKPFYMRRNERDERLVDNFDLLVPRVGEIVGGSLREHRLDVLKEAMAREKLSVDSYRSYLETKEFGGMKLGGFGLGVERFMQFLLNIDNIRDTCAFPRSLNNCKM